MDDEERACVLAFLKALAKSGYLLDEPAMGEAVARASTPEEAILQAMGDSGWTAVQSFSVFKYGWFAGQLHAFQKVQLAQAEQSCRR